MTDKERVKYLQDELYRCRTAENHAAVELDIIRQELGISQDIRVFDIVLSMKNRLEELERNYGY